MPYDLRAYPVNSAVITVEWKPPTNPNGQITSYTVKWNEKLHFSRSLTSFAPHHYLNALACVQALHLGGVARSRVRAAREKRRECEGRWTRAHSRVHSRLTSHTTNRELASRLWTPGTGQLNEIEKFLPILTLAIWKSEGVVTIILRKVWTPEIFLRREKAKPKATPVFKAFWHDITCAMLVSHNSETAAMLVHQTF